MNASTRSALAAADCIFVYTLDIFRTGSAVVGTLLTKLRQFQPGVPNLLVIAAQAGGDALDVPSVVRSLRARADRKDDAFFATRGFSDARGFYASFLRLGGVIVWDEGADGDDRAVEWINPSARIAVPERTVRATVAALRGSP